MIETDEDTAEAARDGEAMLYDYFKHLTSLCIVSLGGVLALVPNAKGTSSGLIIAVLAVVSVAALLSFSGAGEIVRARHGRKPVHKNINICRVAAPMLLSIGVGMFIYLFTWTLYS